MPDLTFRQWKLTARSLLGRPAYSLIVVATLGLGLGATAVLLAVADAVILRPLPYPQPDRLVSLHETVAREGLEQRRTFSYPDFLAVRERADAFESIAAIETDSVVLRTAEESGDAGYERLRGAWVSPAYFDVLGVAPRLGRAFAPETATPKPNTSETDTPQATDSKATDSEATDSEATDSEAEAAPGTGVDAEVVLSHDLWTNRFAARRDVLGETVTLDGESYRVIGVMPASFGDEDGHDLYLSTLLFGPEIADQRHSRSFGVIARLAPGATIEQARAQVDTIFAGLEEAWPESNSGYGGGVVSMHRDAVGDLRRPVLLLGGAVTLLLLLSGFNVANMMLVESLRRRRAAAIRLALGASPWHLFRQVLVETLLLALTGAGLGLLIAAWGLPVLGRISPVELPTWAALDVNLRVAAMTIATVAALGTLLAAIIAWQGVGFGRGSSGSLEVARHGARTVGARTIGDPGGDRLRRLLLGAQIALAFVVAVGAVLLSSSFYEWSRIDTGFSERELVFFHASLPQAEPEEALALRRELLERAMSVPGAESAALATDVPLEGGYSATVVAAEGALPRPDEAYGGGHRTYHHVVQAEYFDTLGLPILRGRGFDGNEPFEGEGVVVISERLADRLWPGGDAVGRRLRFGPPRAEVDADTLWVTVIGVAGEARHRNLRPDAERVAEDPDLYLSLRQFPRRQLAVATRVAGQAEERLIALRRAMEPLEARMPLFAWRTLADNLDRELRTSRFSTLMMTLFAGLALLLAAIGVYGVFSHRVQERRREIGVRLALGAYRDRIALWLLRDAAAVIAVGVAVGAGGAYLLGRVLERTLGDLLYGVAAGDLRLFAAVAALVSVSALLACLLPARQATRVDPQIVLREE